MGEMSLRDATRRCHAISDDRQALLVTVAFDLKKQVRRDVVEVGFFNTIVGWRLARRYAMIGQQHRIFRRNIGNTTHEILEDIQDMIEGAHK